MNLSMSQIPPAEDKSSEDHTAANQRMLTEVEERQESMGGSYEQHSSNSRNSHPQTPENGLMPALSAVENTIDRKMSVSKHPNL